MADTLVPKPPADQIVTQERLLQAQWAQWRTASAFTGMRDPSSIWAMMVREDSNAIPLYRELEDKDYDVSCALDALKLSVLEKEWTITPGDESAAAIDAAADMEAQFANIDVDSAFDAQLDACAYGFSVGELMFDSSEGQARLLSIDDCPQELFLFGQRFQPQTGPMQVLNSIGASTGTLVPEEKFVIFTYRGRSRSRLGRPLLKSVFWPSWIKRQALAIWLKATEKSNGMALARYNQGATASEIQLALETAEALAEGVAFAAPENMMIDVDLLKLAQSGNGDANLKLYQQMQYAIARAIQGETLTSFGSEGGSGSRAHGQTHQETFDQRSLSLAKKHNRVVNTQIVRRLHLWNYGPQVAQPKFSWDISEEIDLVQIGTVLSTAQRLGIPMGTKWAAEKMEVPPVDKDDVPLVANVNAATEPAPTSAFSEVSPRDARQAHADVADLDILAAQLRDDSAEKFKVRVREVAEQLQAGSK